MRHTVLLVIQQLASYNLEISLQQHSESESPLMSRLQTHDLFNIEWFLVLFHLQLWYFSYLFEIKFIHYGSDQNNLQSQVDCRYCRVQNYLINHLLKSHDHDVTTSNFWGCSAPRSSKLEGLELPPPSQNSMIAEL